MAAHHRHHHHHNLRVLFVCKSRGFQYGLRTPSGLLNSVRMCAEVLNQYQGISAEVVDVVDGNAIDREVARYRPTHVIIDALWAQPTKILELMLLYPLVQWVVRVHSKAPFIAGEGRAFSDLMDLRDIAIFYRTLSVAANSDVFADELSDVLELDCLYLPNIFTGDNLYAPAINRPGELHIGCFGAIRLLKNQLIQGIAAIRFANDLDRVLHFHINGGYQATARVEQAGLEPLKNLRALFGGQEDHRLVEHGWLDHQSFTEVIRQMDLGMQVSYSESYNIVAADFVDQGVPTIVSPDIAWFVNRFKADPNSSEDQESKLNRLWQESQRDRGQVQNELKIALNTFNAVAVDTWLRWLAEQPGP